MVPESFNGLSFLFSRFQHALETDMLVPVVIYLNTLMSPSASLNLEPGTFSTLPRICVSFTGFSIRSGFKS